MTLGLSTRPDSLGDAVAAAPPGEWLTPLVHVCCAVTLPLPFLHLLSPPLPSPFPSLPLPIAAPVDMAELQLMQLVVPVTALTMGTPFQKGRATSLIPAPPGEVAGHILEHTCLSSVPSPSLLSLY